MKNTDLDYLNKLKQYTTNPRGQSQQLYRNYRNEGLSNYPHIQDYERMVAQQAAQRGAEQGLTREYETNKNKLIQDEEARFKAMTTENERLRQVQAQQQAAKQAMQQPQAQIYSPFAAKIERDAQRTRRQQASAASAASAANKTFSATVAPKATAITPPQSSSQYPAGTQFAPSNWREMPPWSYPRGTRVIGSPGEVVSYSGTPPSWYS